MSVVAHRAARALLPLLALLPGAALPPAPAGAAELVPIQHGQPGVVAVAQRGLAFAPKGTHVYASSDEFLLAFRRRSDGGLALVHAIPIGGADPLRNPTALAVSPDGRHLYVCGLFGTIGVFARDASSGALTAQPALDQDEGLGLACGGLAVAPGGAFVYASGRGVGDGRAVDVLATYARDPEDGALAFVDRLVQGEAGVSGLEGGGRIAISADGAFLYVAGTEQGEAGTLGTIAVLARGPDGRPDPVQVVRQGEDGVEGLAGVPWLELAPDGAELVALAATAGDVARFGRDPATGFLSFREAVSSPALGGPGLLYWLAFRPDGGRLYLGSLAGIGTFARDPASGALGHLETADSHLGYAGGMAPGGRHLVTTGGVALHVWAVPEPAAAPAGAAALLALSRLARRGRRRGAASARARTTR